MPVIQTLEESYVDMSKLLKLLNALFPAGNFRVQVDDDSTFWNIPIQVCFKVLMCSHYLGQRRIHPYYCPARAEQGKLYPAASRSWHNVYFADEYGLALRRSVKELKRIRLPRCSVYVSRQMLLKFTSLTLL